MVFEHPRGILVAGGATSQLLGVALQLYFLRRGVLLEIFYVQTKMSHTQGFIFQDIITSQQVSSSNKIEKYLPKFLWRHQHLLRQIYSFFGRKFSSLSVKKSDTSLRALVIPFDNQRETVATWCTSTGLVNGGIWPGIIGITADELTDLFSKSSLPNPFNLNLEASSNIAIHYRLGDMRTDPHWRKTHGVMDPSTIRDEVEKISLNIVGNIPKHVYSDEPHIAKLLLESAGLFGCTYMEPSDIWSDLSRMCNSTYFIGSFSTVSMVAAEIRTIHGYSASHLPANCRKHRLSQKIKNTDYFEARILPLRHWVYRISASAN